MKKISIIATIAIVALASSCNSLRSSNEVTEPFKEATFRSNIAKVLISTKAELNSDNLLSFRAVAYGEDEFASVFDNTFTKNTEGFFANKSVARPETKVAVLAVAGDPNQLSVGQASYLAVTLPSSTDKDLVAATAYGDCSGTSLEFSHLLNSLVIKMKKDASVPSTSSIVINSIGISSNYGEIDYNLQDPNNIKSEYNVGYLQVMPDYYETIASPVTTLTNTMSEVCSDVYVFPIGDFVELDSNVETQLDGKYGLQMEVAICGADESLESKTIFVPVPASSIKSGYKTTLNVTLGLSSTFGGNNNVTVTGFQTNSEDLNYTI